MNFDQPKIENKATPEKENMIFEGVPSFEEVYSRLAKIDGLTTSRGEFHSSELLEVFIDHIRKGKMSLKMLTNSEGLRDAVGELLAKEKKPN